jgi:hypothetical protein
VKCGWFVWRLWPPDYVATRRQAIGRERNRWRDDLAKQTGLLSKESRRNVMMMKSGKRKGRAPLPPDETSEQLQARLRAYALATRAGAMEPTTVSFPEHVTVLAGPLKKRFRRDR